MRILPSLVSCFYWPFLIRHLMRWLCPHTAAFEHISTSVRPLEWLSQCTVKTGGSSLGSTTATKVPKPSTHTMSSLLQPAHTHCLYLEQKFTFADFFLRLLNWCSPSFLFCNFPQRPSAWEINAWSVHTVRQNRLSQFLDVCWCWHTAALNTVVFLKSSVWQIFYRRTDLNKIRT